VIASLALITKKFGANVETDVFLMAQVWPLLMANLGKAVMNISLIPVFVEVFRKENEENAWRFASNTFNLLVIGILAAATLYFGLAHATAKTLIHLDIWDIDKASSDFLFLTTLFLPVIILNPIFAFWESILFSKKDYYMCGIATLLIGVCEILSILFLAERFGLKAVAIGISFGYLLQLLFILPKFRRERKYFGVSASLRYPGTKAILPLMLPTLYLVFLAQIFAAVDWVLASVLGEGRITSLFCAATLAYFVPRFFATSAVTPLLGRFSESIVERDYDSLKVIILRTIRFVFLTIIPFCVWFAVMREPIAKFLFLRGEFSLEALGMVRSVLSFLIPVIFFQCINAIFRQTLIAMKQMRFLLIEGSAILILKITLSIVLMRYMDVAGLALGTAIASGFDCAALVWCFRSEAKPFPKAGTVLFFGKILVASLLTGVCVWYLSRHFDGLLPMEWNLGAALRLVLSAVTGAAVYLGLISLFGALRLKDPLGWETDQS